jgi:hypothetical protein
LWQTIGTMTAQQILNEVSALSISNHAWGASLHQKCVQAFESDFDFADDRADGPRRLPITELHPEISLSRDEVTFAKKKRLIDRSSAIDEHISSVLARAT